MDSIKELILVVQAVAPGAALFRIVYYIITTMNDDDKTAGKKKIRNILVALVFIETVLTILGIIRGYYR